MSSLIGNLIGSAAALLPLAVALLIVRHRHHLPGKASEWSLIAAILLMLLSGAEFAYAGAGTWLTSTLMWIRGEIGSAGPVIFAIVALVLLLRVAVAVLKQPDEKAIWVAFMLPIVAATFSFGLFHNIDTALAPLAQSVTAHIQNALGA